VNVAAQLLRLLGSGSKAELGTRALELLVEALVLRPQLLALLVSHLLLVALFLRACTAQGLRMG
jgi:hypothetical protein